MFVALSKTSWLDFLRRGKPLMIIWLWVMITDRFNWSSFLTHCGALDCHYRGFLLVLNSFTLSSGTEAPHTAQWREKRTARPSLASPFVFIKCANNVQYCIKQDLNLIYKKSKNCNHIPSFHCGKGPEKGKKNLGHTHFQKSDNILGPQSLK